MKTYGTIRYLPRIRLEPPTRVEWRRAMFEVDAQAHVATRLKRLFRRIHLSSGGFRIVATPEVARELTWILLRWPMVLDQACSDALAVLTQQQLDTEMIIEQILAGERPPGLRLEAARPLRDYQQTAADMAFATNRLLCGDDVGLGKTTVGIGVLLNPETLPALVVTLTHLPKQWVDEIGVVAPHLKCHILKNTTPYALPEGTEVVVTNYAKLRHWAPHLTGVMRTVIFDEAQELRTGEGSEKYAAAKMIADEAGWRLGLTMTPIYNYGDEMFHVVSVLDADVLGSKDEFLREWCVTGGGHHLVQDPKALGLSLRDQGIYLRRTKKDVGRELPHEPQLIEYPVDYSRALFEASAQGVEKLANSLLHGALSPQERWKAAGEVDWRLRQATGIAKAKHVAEFVNMLVGGGQKVLLYGWHHEVYARWRKDIGGNLVMFTGQESETQKRVAKEAFCKPSGERGSADVMVMSLRAGAGLDGLQHACSTVVFGELDWSPQVHAQCIGRVARDGQQDPVTAFFCISQVGSDPAIADVLDIKKMQSTPITDPDAPSVEIAAVDGDRIRLLAQRFLDQRKHKPDDS